MERKSHRIGPFADSALAARPLPNIEILRGVPVFGSDMSLRAYGVFMGRLTARFARFRIQCDSRRIQLASFCLIGPPARWLDTLDTDNLSWEAFVGQLEGRYVPAAAVARRMSTQLGTRLGALRMGASATAYSDEFEARVGELRLSSKMDYHIDTVVRNIFVRGLTPQYRAIITRRRGGRAVKFHRLRDMVDVVKEVEARLSQNGDADGSRKHTEPT